MTVAETVSYLESFRTNVEAVNGVEIVNAYSELVDPIEQMKRLEEQAKLNAAGDEDAMVKDEDYVMSMEYGMPPISGWGIGIDRLVQFVTNSENIKDCVLFPLTRKAQGHELAEGEGVPGSEQNDFEPKV